jgi:hypothetical protein
VFEILVYIILWVLCMFLLVLNVIKDGRILELESAIEVQSEQILEIENHRMNCVETLFESAKD